MKKTLLFLFAIAMAANITAQTTFTQVVNGKTLHFQIIGGGAYIMPDASYLNFNGTLTIPGTVTYGGTTYNVLIHNEAFMGCTGLTTVDIDGGDQTTNAIAIGQYAFKNCTGITRLNLKACASSIGSFDSCTGLQNIYCYGYIALNYYGTMNFTGVSSTTPIHIPVGYTAWYESTEGYFTNFIEDIDNGGGGGGGNQGEDDCTPITSFPWNNTFDANLSCWQTIDQDGDGYDWFNYENYAVSESYYAIDDENGIPLTPDNWLISRRIQIPASGNYSLSWTAKAFDQTYYAEHYSVYVTTSTSAPYNFNTQLYSETLSSSNPVSRSASLQNYRGQTIRIAFRHHNTTDKYVLGITNVKVSSQSSQGIDDVATSDLNVYAANGRIVVSSNIPGQISIYDAMGRKVASWDNVTGQKESDILPNGVYIVRTGESASHKVIVVR